MTKTRQLLDALWPVAVLWLALIAFAIWQNATWPDTTRRIVSFVALTVVATFLVLLATIMLRRMHGLDHLTIALSLAFATSALMPFYLMASQLWRAFFTEHRFSLTMATAAALIVGAGVAIIALISTPEDEYAAEQRAEGVTEGHASGVADEQIAQRVREECNA